MDMNQSIMEASRPQQSFSTYQGDVVHPMKNLNKKNNLQQSTDDERICNR